MFSVSAMGGKRASPPMRVVSLKRLHGAQSTVTASGTTGASTSERSKR